MGNQSSNDGGVLTEREASQSSLPHDEESLTIASSAQSASIPSISSEQARELLKQRVGYRVLGVQSLSPGSQCGLVSYFDFIVCANNTPLNALNTTFLHIIQSHEDRELKLVVYNVKQHSLREVCLVPNKRWAGEGLLGITIKFDVFTEAEEHLLHVLEVEANSPAEIAGLVPVSDYLLGTAERDFSDVEVLIAELKKHEERPLEVYVYNVETDEVRVVVILPTQDWEGDGLLGAELGSGYLHRLPQTVCATLGRSNEISSPSAVHSPFGVNPVPLSAPPLPLGVSVPPSYSLSSAPLSEPSALSTASSLSQSQERPTERQTERQTESA